MSFLRSRAEQLADHLRGSIARGELHPPLPAVRDWSARLGVGRGTLEQALRILAKDGLLRVVPRRGIELLSLPKPTEPSRARLVRWIFYGRDYPDISIVTEMLAAVAERLRVDGIRLSVERCDGTRLQTILRRGEDASEMFILASLPLPFLRRFTRFERSALMLGSRDGIGLPYVSIDVTSAIRHAVQWLVRRGFSRVCLVVNARRRMQQVDAFFHRLCRDWPTPLRGEIVKIPLEMEDQAAAAQRFAAVVRGRLGVVAIYPIPATVLMTALMKRGIDVPDQVEVVAVNTTRHAVRAAPIPLYYPYPVEAFARTIHKLATHYFLHGRLPPVRKLIPLEVVRPR